MIQQRERLVGSSPSGSNTFSRRPETTLLQWTLRSATPNPRGTRIRCHSIPEVPPRGSRPLDNGVPPGHPIGDPNAA
jgi:hypothetical protein